MFLPTGGDGGSIISNPSATVEFSANESNPNAIRDKEGKLQVAAVDGDNGLWVNTVGIGATPTMRMCK